MHTVEPNVITEYKGIKIALTPDYKFMAVGSELFNGGKYHSLKNVKGAIDTRLLSAARLQVQTVRLLVLDDEGNECEITGIDPKDDGPERLLGLPRHCYRFYPRADWIANALTKIRALEAELSALINALHAVKLEWIPPYYENCTEVEEKFDCLLEEFEQKRKLAEAGPPAITSVEDE